ncbi:MAG: NAD(P)H-dependent oxidoreductase [Verrucomicrobia bacterium]|nr:NAD(P)H-dependent oxidoreductase [Verrucomicrobiota bacterium]
MNNQPIDSHELLSALNWRYATKVFDPNRQLPAATWNALQEALALSASSFGLQPYRFIVVNDPATRAKLLPHAWNQPQVVNASHFIVFAARTAMTEAEIDRFLDRIVEVRGVNRDSLADYRQMMAGSLLGDDAKARIPHWTARQCYIALGNLLTSAALLGVDACPMEGFVPAEFDKILGLPAQGCAAVVCCALGYRSADDKYAAAPKVRFPSAALIQIH